MTLRKASRRTLRIITLCACLVFAVLLVVLIVTLKESSSTYGCDKATWTCRTGLGSMTQQDCDATCKNSTYGCNPASGKCESGFGQMPEGCPNATCEKLTWQCDEQSWGCKDTQTVTHTSQSGCQCDPGLALHVAQSTQLSQPARNQLRCWLDA